MSELWCVSHDCGPGVLVHGGAGRVAPERRAEHRDGCLAAARAGAAVVSAGGSALDAVQAAARVLEDLPQFNAGTGAALTEAGTVEHDAAIMCGATLAAGAVAAVSSFKNPIDLARAVLDQGRHVLLVGEGARAFAKRAGFEQVAPETLVTDAAREALARYLSEGKESGWAGGTIGAVALDRAGHLAAATSTGGTLGKWLGRVGDSPILGAGTLADDTSCALSATGDGEGILKVGLARVIAVALSHGVEPEVAVASALSQLTGRARASGGLILMAPTGRVTLARSTETMSWAFAGERGEGAGV